MSTEIYEFGDGHGNSFRMSLEIPIVRSWSGSWRTIDKSYIRYNSGKTKTGAFKGVGGEDDDLLLLRATDGTWGMRLEDYQDIWGLNDQGKGTLLQVWAMKMKPGTISWSHVG